MPESQPSHENRQALALEQQKAMEKDPREVLYWFAESYIPFFISHWTQEQVTDEKAHYQKLNQFVQDFLLLAKYMSRVNDNAIFPEDLKQWRELDPKEWIFLGWSKLPEHIVQRVKAKRTFKPLLRVMRDFAASNNDGENVFLPPTKLAVAYPQRPRTDEEQERTQLAKIFIHDMRNLLRYPLFIFEDMDGFDPQDPFNIQVIQNFITEFPFLNKCFNLRENREVLAPDFLSTAVTYLENEIGEKQINMINEKKRIEEYQKKGKETDTNYLELDYTTEIEDQGLDLSKIKTHINLPAIVRVFNNMMLNAQRAYKSFEEAFPEEKSTRVFKIFVKIDHGYFRVIFDDEAMGFPVSESATTVISPADGEEVREYVPEADKTYWPGQVVKGTGTGLDGLKKWYSSIKTKDGRQGYLLAGSRTNIRGGRVEIGVPLLDETTELVTD